jgi:hypothetical protein
MNEESTSSRGRPVTPAAVLQTITTMRNLLWHEQPIPPDLVERLLRQSEALAYLVLAKQARWKMRRSWRCLAYQVHAWRRRYADRPLPPLPGPVTDVMPPPAYPKKRRR